MTARVCVSWFDGEYRNSVSLVLEDATTDDIRIETTELPFGELERVKVIRGDSP